MNKNYNKNPYYTNEDITKAVKLSDDFFNKKYRPQLLKTGNHKLGSNVAIFDLPSIVTCKYKCKDCYALKAERMYKNTRVMRAFHYEIILQALNDVNKREYLINYINIELRKHSLTYKLPVVRIHASGDLFSKEYMQLWLDIIQQNKDIQFYTYTKQLDNKTIDYYNNMYSNFNIVKSLIDDKYKNYGDLDYIYGLAKSLEANKKDYAICMYGIKDGHQCMGNCTACLRCSNILFKQH